MKANNYLHYFSRNLLEPSQYLSTFPQSTNQLSTNEYYGAQNPNPMKLPVHYKNQPVHLSYGKEGIRFKVEGRQYYFIVNPWVLWFIIITLAFLMFKPLLIPEQKVVYSLPPSVYYSQPVASATLHAEPEKGNYSLITLTEESKADDEDFTNAFIVEKQLLVSKFLIEAKVARVEQLENEVLLQLNYEISQLFIDKILNNIDIEPHVYQFLTDSLPLRKIETSLMEQAKFNIPASIKLGQAALETAYGRYVKHNNFFGIKAKGTEGEWTNTLEYYSLEEMKRNESKIISKQKLEIDGRIIYKCRVRDKFQTYSSAWNSFREHSLHLSNQQRYAPLFTKGKDYKAWAEKIGSAKHGGVGYATLPVYGELLTKIIDRYQLHLLDY